MMKCHLDAHHLMFDRLSSIHCRYRLKILFECVDFDRCKSVTAVVVGGFDDFYFIELHISFLVY